MMFQARSIAGLTRALSQGMDLRHFPDAEDGDAKTMSGLRVPTPLTPP